QTHFFAFPVPADLPDADQVGRQPAIEGDPVELPVAPEGVDAKRGETTGDGEVSRLRPGGHVGAGDRDGPGGLRVADRGVAALDAYAPNADTKGPDLDVPGQGKDPGAVRLMTGHRHVEVEIVRENGDGELPAPDAREVEAHGDGPGAEPHALGRPGA